MVPPVTPCGKTIPPRAPPSHHSAHSTILRTPRAAGWGGPCGRPQPPSGQHRPAAGRRRGGGNRVQPAREFVGQVVAGSSSTVRTTRDDAIVSQDMIVDMIVSAVRTCQCPKGGGSWVHYHRSTSPYHGQHVRFMQLVHGPYPVQLHDCMRVRGVP